MEIGLGLKHDPKTEICHSYDHFDQGTYYKIDKAIKRVKSAHIKK